jgi:general secretion pathway protein G
MRGIHQRANGRQGGFTLLEVLLVVMILGMLATLIVPTLWDQGERARRDLAQTQVSDAGPVAGPIRLYKMHMGRYPASLADLTRVPDDPAERARYGDKPYIENPDTLKDPWHQELQYKCPGEFNQDDYDLYSFGPDMKEGGGDDIGNWRTTPAQ